MKRPQAWVVPLLLAACLASQAPALEYRIKPGDTLSEIAVRFGVTVEAIQAANGIRGTRIVAGRFLTIPGQETSGAAGALESSEAGATVRVRPGDSLDRIARRNGVSVAALRRANGMDDGHSLIHPDQVLKLPGPGAVTPPPPPPPAAPVTIRHAPIQATEAEVEILARIVKGECWHDTPQDGRVAVAATLLNRVRAEGYPKTIKGVAHQPYQFSCYNAPMRKRLYNGPIPQEAWDAARAALAGEDPTGGATHYFNPHLVKPRWVRGMKKTIRIGTTRRNSHDFYRW